MLYIKYVLTTSSLILKINYWLAIKSDNDYNYHYMRIYNSLNKKILGHNQVILLFVSCFCLIFISTIAYAEKSYIKCWKNAAGLTECGNRIPREFYNQRIRYIDKAGVTRKVKERAKTREELNEQLEIDKLLALEEKQLRQSKGYDNVLLKTYVTIDDLLRALNSKLAIIESRSMVLESTIELKKHEFGNLVRKAANMERSGKPISEQLVLELDSARKSLRNQQAQLSHQEIEIKKIKNIFAHDVERFMLLKANRIKYSLSTPSHAKKLNGVRLSCLNQEQCDLHWDKASEFVEELATTEVLYSTRKIIVTDIPEGYRDIAMSLSLLDGKAPDNKRLLIFQIRCNPEREGQEFCASEDIKNLLTEFKNVVYE